MTAFDGSDPVYALQGEDAGQDRADGAADAVHAEGVAYDTPEVCSERGTSCVLICAPSCT